MRLTFLGAPIKPWPQKDLFGLVLWEVLCDASQGIGYEMQAQKAPGALERPLIGRQSRKYCLGFWKIQHSSTCIICNSTQNLLTLYWGGLEERVVFKGPSLRTQFCDSALIWINRSCIDHYCGSDSKPVRSLILRLQNVGGKCGDSLWDGVSILDSSGIFLHNANVYSEDLFLWLLNGLNKIISAWVSVVAE